MKKDLVMLIVFIIIFILLFIYGANRFNNINNGNMKVVSQSEIDR